VRTFARFGRSSKRNGSVYQTARGSDRSAQLSFSHEVRGIDLSTGRTFLSPTSLFGPVLLDAARRRLYYTDAAGYETHAWNRLAFRQNGRLLSLAF
ncbi:Hypothetical protein UVM_LOCUS90, partial [uncultured virus]